MKGVLLINLGSTDSPDQTDVKEFMDEFLMDKRAMDFPYWLRSIIVRGIILKTRPSKTAANYKRIWWEEGSPLIVIGKRLRDKVGNLIDLPIEIGMRYGEPSIESGLSELVDQGVKQVMLMPLYPQYTMSTIETALVEANKVKKELFPNLELSVFPPFYNNPDYIKVLSDSISEDLKGLDYDHILFSYHGIPVRHERKTNYIPRLNNPNKNKISYRDQCLETTRLVAEKLNLKKGTYSSAFQSRLGIDPWIKPFTDKTVEALPSKGVKKLVVVAPAFVADCVETIDELGREAKDDFIEAGGEEFNFIPCLNDRDDWAETIVRWIENQKKEKATVG
ncbi:MAG TPA: ferrochelatase [Flavobacteriaceae bacterium]|nr:ferrochelatase [Flavobacteriaceae bacterium]